MESNEIAERLSENVERFRTRMADAGFTLSGDRCHAIAPVMLGDARLSNVFADKMLRKFFSCFYFQLNFHRLLLYRKRYLRNWIQLPCRSERRSKNKSATKCRSFFGGSR